MTRTPDRQNVADTLQDQAADCLRQAELESRHKSSESLKGLAESYLKIARLVEARLERHVRDQP